MLTPSSFINRSIKRYITILIILLLLTATLFILSLLLGEGNILTLENKTLAKKLLWFQRFPQAITALLCGASLAVAGLILQSWFRNPLAESSLLGISSGASFGIALITMGKHLVVLSGNSFLFSFFQFAAAPIGALIVILILMSFIGKGESTVKIILLGIMVNYLTSALTSLLIHFSNAQEVKNFINWSFGSFGAVSINQIPIFSATLLFAIFVSAFLTTGLNLLALGDENAFASGLSIKPFQTICFLTVALISGITTLFCGPIAFIGIAAPHFARLLLRSGDHRKLYPISLLFGSILALVSDIVSRKISLTPLPVNSILALIGVPILFSMMIKGYKPLRKSSIKVNGFRKNNILQSTFNLEDDIKHFKMPSKAITPHSLKIPFIKISINDHFLFEGENLFLKSKTVTALLGANGSGKSSFIKTLLGFNKIDQGHLIIKNEIKDYILQFELPQWKKLSPKKRASLISFLFSKREDSLLLTAFEVIAFSILPNKDFIRPLSISVSPQLQHYILETLKKVDLTHLAFKEVSTFSDGEFRRLLIAKAIAQETPIIILDEPLAFLDTENKILILKLLRELADSGKTILFSSHEPHLLADYVDAFFMIKENRITPIDLQTLSK